MNSRDQILVVGAGPSGLSSAVFLVKQGIKPRIIERNTHISQFSKALGVNPRTLQLLEPTGLTSRFLEKGRKMEKINIWKGNQHIYQNNLSKISHAYPFMLILAQKESEAILLEELNNRKLEVEFGKSFHSMQKESSHIRVVMENSRREREEQEFSLLIGADGARSEVKRQTGIPSYGFRYEEDWRLYDVELELPVSRDEGHVRLFPEGAMILIRLRDNIWRVAGNLPSMFNYLPNGSKVGKIIWESSFKISHRVAKELYKDRVVLIGDAAHLHSPVGARGMNLGIEDAYLVSQLIAENEIESYTRVRGKYLNRTVGRINQITRVLGGDDFFARSIRTHLQCFKFAFPLVMPVARKFVMGLNR